MGSANTYNDVARSLTVNVRDEVKRYLASFSPLPISFDDIFSGHFGKIENKIEDSPDIMIPVRKVSHFLSRTLKKTMDTVFGIPEELISFSGFANELTRFVEQRHHFDKPEIFRVTPNSVSPAFIQNLQKSEQVHPFTGDKDLQVRMNHPNRAIYAWRDPYGPDNALISIQIAFTDGMAKKIRPIIGATDRARHPNVATPYSISNWKVVADAGEHFIHAATDALRAENPWIEQIVTLSPMTGFRDAVLKNPVELPKNKAALRILAAQYLLSNKREADKFVMMNGVADFHLQCGAKLADICPEGNPKDKEALGFMANYEYGSNAECAKNAQGFRAGNPACSPEMKGLSHAYPS